MSAVAIVRALMVVDSNLVASVPTARMIAGVIPQGTALPCIGLTEISAGEVSHIDANAEFILMDSTVQATVLAATYPEAKQIRTLLRKACSYKRGSLAGFTVVSVRRLSIGPDITDLDTGICMQSLDFDVLYYEPN